eukprot:SAG11_NODE_38643_length_251_cov_1.013158_1_plen_38_part_01
MATSAVAPVVCPLAPLLFGLTECTLEDHGKDSEILGVT